MHMNARPRGFWNGLGNLAFPHGAHLPSKVSQEMAANVTNAWSTQRHMTQSVLGNQGWESLDEAGDANPPDTFLSNVPPQPYAFAPSCIHITATSQYEDQTYQPSSFFPNTPFRGGNHHAQTIYNVPGYYQSPLGNQISFEPFQCEALHLLGVESSSAVNSVSNGGTWHGVDHRSNTVNPIDEARYVDYASLSRRDSRDWPASYGGGCGVLNQGAQQSTVSPQRLSIHTVSSPALSYSDSIGFWTPLPSPIKSSADFPSSLSTARGSFSEGLSSEGPCTQQENDYKATLSVRTIRPGEGLGSHAASIPLISTIPARDPNNQDTTHSTAEADTDTETNPALSLHHLAPITTTTTTTTTPHPHHHPHPLSQSPSPRARRATQDAFLLRARANGLSYKEIRRRGHFREAESTLRGRVRALQKRPSERVRRPEWTAKDDDLLVEKVADLAEQNWSLRSQAPWRQVSEYIWRNGGSYRFGYATCRKRWEDLNALNDD